MGLVQGVVGGAEDAAEGAGIQAAEEEVEVSMFKLIHSRYGKSQRICMSLLGLHITQLSWQHILHYMNIIMTAGLVT